MQSQLRAREEKECRQDSARVYYVRSGDLPSGFPVLPFRRPVRLLACGSREWDDWNLIRAVFRIVERYYGVSCLIEGEAQGADLRCADVAEKILGLPEKKIWRFPADWANLGRRAGPMRNSQMLREGKPSVVIAFHDNLNESRGTKDMVLKASAAGVPVVVISHGRRQRAEEGGIYGED